MSNIIIVISVVVVILIVVIAFIVMMIKGKKNKNVSDASILDVQNIGVSTNNQEFSYGYEKEETIVMQPVTQNSVIQPDDSTIKNNVSEDSKVLNVSTADVAKDSANTNVATNEVVQNAGRQETLDDLNNEQIETLEVE